jgi:excisionase family DNA binding protein
MLRHKNGEGLARVEEGQLLTVAQVADRLQVNSETVRRWLRAGELEGILLGDKAGYRVSVGALRAFLEKRRPPPRG